MNIKSLLEFCVNEIASDLHLSANQPPLLRIDGEVTATSFPPISEKHLQDMLGTIVPDIHRDGFEQGVEVDFCFNITEISRFRVHIYRQYGGLAAAFRCISLEVPSLEKLGLQDVYKSLSTLSSGLVVIAGPTGSGKSSSMAAMLDFLNNNERRHIVSIEDPIEFVHLSKKCLIHQREVGQHSESFASALRAALREDPDVIAIGELRDLETINLALTAAETGHLVLATLHTASAATSINRVIDVFPAAEQHTVRSMLSQSLRAIICQRLLKKSDSGRVLANEILMVNNAVSNLIREDKIAQIYSVMQTSQSRQMHTLEQNLEALAHGGEISIETAKRCFTKPF